MANSISGKLTVKQLDAFTKPGLYSDGGGLFLVVTPSGSRNWTFRYQLNGRRREMGLGPYPAVGLAAARRNAEDLRRSVKRDGVDPLQERQLAAAALAQAEALKRAEATTFMEVACEYIAAHRASWRNPKHAKQWESTLTTYAAPVFASTPVADISKAMVHEVLKPIWATKTETATRVRSRIELVLDYAEAKGMRPEGMKNPAEWSGLRSLLGSARKIRQVVHHPALPYHRLPELLSAVRARDGMGARALEFLILTAARSGEVRGATWDEIDVESRVWTVQADRMKAKRGHRVPLSLAAVQLLSKLPTVPQDSAGVGNLVFPGTRDGRPLSDMSLTAHLRGMVEEGFRFVDDRGQTATAHGFRSSFRDWAAEMTHYPAELAEMALAHTVGSKVEAAYRRGDMFAKRRALMDDWAAWCNAPPTRNVESIAARFR